LFSDAAQQSEPLMALADHLLGELAEECAPDDDHLAGLRLRAEAPQSFRALRDELRQALRDNQHPFSDNGIHTFATKRALLARLAVSPDQEGRAVFDEGTGQGQPPRVVTTGTPDPLIIDIAALPPELRRFVVAAVLDQTKTQQMSERRVPGQVYFL